MSGLRLARPSRRSAAVRPGSARPQVSGFSSQVSSRRSPVTGHRSQAAGFSSAFTLVEVMMAATMLSVGFLAMIQAMVIGSGMMDNARRQTLAAQILNHEIEALRLHSWTAIAALPTAATTLNGTWSITTAYYIGDTVNNSGVWYRCTTANTGQTPASSPTYWKVDTPPYASVMSTSRVAYGATYTLTRAVADVVSNDLREVTFTISWVVTTSRRDSNNNLLTFSYSRTMPAYYGKYGLNLSNQRL